MNSRKNVNICIKCSKSNFLNLYFLYWWIVSILLLLSLKIVTNFFPNLHWKFNKISHNQISQRNEKDFKKKNQSKKNNESIQKNDIKQNIKQDQFEEIERKYNEIMQKIRDGTIIYSDSNLKEENERERKNINGETVFTCKVRNCDYESVFNSSFCFKHKSAIL